ncbi:ABCAA protein, partial [Psilopogon haemacephalus]|nr:ABCAA protein [Psilopogon haemacephalus]
ALVDVPLFWSLMCLMFGVVLLMNRICPLQAADLLTLIVCVTGYGVSLVLLTYIIAFACRRGRSNRYLWCFIFILLNLILSMFVDHHKLLYCILYVLIPGSPLLGWL